VAFVTQVENTNADHITLSKMTLWSYIQNFFWSFGRRAFEVSVSVHKQSFSAHNWMLSKYKHKYNLWKRGQITKLGSSSELIVLFLFYLIIQEAILSLWIWYKLSGTGCLPFQNQIYFSRITKLTVHNDKFKEQRLNSNSLGD